MKKIEYLTDKEKEINEIAQKALKEVDGCIYLRLSHGVDNRCEYAIRCAETPLTYVLLETGTILSDKQYYNIGRKTQRDVKRFLAYKRLQSMPNWKAVPQTSNLLQIIFDPRHK